MNNTKKQLMASCVLGGALLSGFSTQSQAGANFIFLNQDGAGEGFNDPTPVAAVTGNPGTTVGEQRINVFMAAFAEWGGILNSSVDIRVQAQFDVQFCTTNSATLGSAGPLTGHRDFTNAPLANTWYGGALANAIAGSDLNVGSNDINATFNSALNGDASCLSGLKWDYQIPSSTSLSLFSVVLHELGHGLNFLTFANAQNGTLFNGLPDVYLSFLRDQGTNKAWSDMTDGERAASAISGNVFWTGSSAKAAATALPLTTGQDGGTQNIEMFAPNPFSGGSSISHWDISLVPNELMEPSSTPNPQKLVTTAAFEDMGWSLVVPEADLSVLKVASADPVTAGDALSYTVTVDNDGPDAAVNVVVTDTLPGCVTFTSTSGCDNDPNGVPNCQMGGFPSGTTDNYTILVDTTGCPAGSISNLVAVTSDTQDPVAGNDSYTLLTTVALPPASADLSITKTDSVDPVTAGNQLTYTINVSNAGPDTATAVQVTDTLPAGVTFVSTSGCTEDTNAVPTCTLGDIASGASKQYTVVVQVDNGTSGSISNTAVVASATNDPVPGNNTATEATSVTALPPSADLSITKTDSVDPVTAGNQLTYTITVSNAGPDTATAVQVTDTLPAGVTFVSTSGCTEDANGVPTCSLGNISSGSSKQYTVVVQVDNGTTGSISNTAAVTSTTADPVPGNNSAIQATTVDAAPPTDADLSITKTDSADPIMAGSQLSYTITVSNAGPATATNVQVAETLPAGVTFVSTSGCNNDPNGVATCNLGDITSGGSKQYAVVVDIDQTTSGSITNTVTVSTDTNDPVAANNTANEATSVSEYGDLTFDGCIGRDDARSLILSIRAGNTDPALDFNGDGKVTRTDVRIIPSMYDDSRGACP